MVLWFLPFSWVEWHWRGIDMFSIANRHLQGIPCEHGPEGLQRDKVYPWVSGLGRLIVWRANIVNLNSNGPVQFGSSCTSCILCHLRLRLFEFPCFACKGLPSITICWHKFYNFFSVILILQFWVISVSCIRFMMWTIQPANHFNSSSMKISWSSVVIVFLTLILGI